MSPAQKTGFLVTIEGIDGTGKSTLTPLLVNALRAQLPDVVQTKEPGGCSLGVAMRQMVNAQPVPLCPWAEYFLFAADRAQHFHEIVMPSLARGAVVISDRMADSSVVYQGYGRGLDIDLISRINQVAMQGREPDLTFFVELNVDVAFKRLSQRQEAPTAFEREKKSFMEAVARGYQKHFAGLDRVVRLNGLLSPLELADQAVRITLDRLRARQ